MKRFFSFLLAISISLSTWAHEGMWIPSLLKAVEGDMQAMGLKLSAEDIYSINNSSLKDAIVHFGGGCTAELVSSKGLLLTNHHCGLGNIQSHSSVDNDYIKDGFWAMKGADELKNEGLTATIIVRIEDVTKQLNKGVTEGMSEPEADKLRAENAQIIQEKAVKGTGYAVVIRPFYYGNEYYMIITNTFKDVRLVGAPPAGIGKFGGDTDNWVWPRHTGDFSVFRIYANKNNQPAEISDSNVPYQPENYLKVSMEGVQEGDFTMVFGFPGRTSQYLTSYEVKDYIDVINPSRIEMRTKSLDIIDAAMSQSDKVRIQYTSKQSRISNAHKKWIGQNLGLKEKGALAKKQAQEGEYLKRVPRDGKYKNVLQDLKLNQEKFIKYDLANSLFVEIWYYGPEILRFSNGFSGLQGDDFDAELLKLKDGIAGYFKNYDVNIDAEIYKKLIKLYVEQLDPSLRPDGVKTDDAYVEYLYAKSNFTSEEKVNKLLSYPKKKLLKKLAKDPAYLMSQKIYYTYLGEVMGMYRGLNADKDALMKRYLAAQMEYFPEKTFFADANSTLRLTYGKIEGSSPRDGMNYSYYTTIDGIIAKNNTGASDFSVPTRLKELYDSKNYGPYTTDGELRVCLLGSNHTTGGNSGSPALNAEGHLIGLNFDRSWESTMSDVMFDPSICRNIMVDVKYVLWVMDIYANAGHLVKEMTLVDSEYRVKQKQMELKSKIQTYTNRLRDVPSDAYAYMGRAAAHKELGMTNEYESDIDKALEIEPENISSLNEKAKYLNKKGMNEKALEIIKKSLAVDSKENIEAYFVRGYIYAEMKKHAEAIKDFDKVIQLDYTFYKAYYDRGVCHSELGNVDEACRNFEIAKNMGDKKAQAMHHLNCEFGAW
ncbi:MAG: Tfp pilus assembly protein PilF [Flavobacteriales bacterium]|jgi:Tfp pilus assembly protein PilF